MEKNISCSYYIIIPSLLQNKSTIIKTVVCLYIYEKFSWIDLEPISMGQYV